jgi:hypothetical protein
MAELHQLAESLGLVYEFDALHLRSKWTKDGAFFAWDTRSALERAIEPLVDADEEPVVVVTGILLCDARGFREQLQHRADRIAEVLSFLVRARLDLPATYRIVAVADGWRFSFSKQTIPWSTR